jgi:hypothetical protein
MAQGLRPLFLATIAAIVVPLACGGGTGGEGGTGGNGSGGLDASSGGVTGAGGATSSGGSQSATGGTGSLSGGTSSGGIAGGFGGLGGLSGDFEPDDLWVTTSGTACWELELTAFTLKDGDDGLELYVAVRNGGTEPTCGVQLTVELFDESGVSLAAATNTLKHPSHYLWQIDAENSVIVDCLAPDEMSMGALTNFPAGLQLADVAYLYYGCPSLKLPVEARVDVLVTDVEPIPTDDGTAYVGEFQNNLELDLSGVMVTVFSTTASGRPFGMTTAVAEEDVPAGGVWQFETEAVDNPGARQAAFAFFDSPL